MAEQEIKTTEISPIGEDTIKAIKEKSVFNFPNNPSAAGKTPQQIRDAFTQPILDSSESVIGEINRVVGEANDALDQRVKVVKSTTSVLYGEDSRGTVQYTPHIDTQGSTIVRRSPYGNIYASSTGKEPGYENLSSAQLVNSGHLESRLRDATESIEQNLEGFVPKTALQGEGDPKAGNVPVYQEGYGSTSGEYFPILFTGYPMEDKHATNKGYVDDEITKIGDEVTALRAGLAGNTRSYVIGDMLDLENMLEGILYVGGRELVDVDTLLTGDNILLRQMNAPDFWFERTETGTPPTYVYVEYDEKGNEKKRIEYTLSVKTKKDGPQVGILHVLESDYSLIEGKAISAGKAAQEAQAAAQEVNNALGGYVKKTDADANYAQKHCPSKGITRIWVSDGENGYWMKTCYNRQDQAIAGNIPFYVDDRYGMAEVTGSLITSSPKNPYQAANKKYVDETIGALEDQAEAALDRIIAIQESLIGGDAQ